MQKENKKTLKEHYDNEVKKHRFSPRCTMIDNYTRNLEVLKIENTIKKILEQNNVENILEIGCGNGYTISKLANKFNCKFTGMDVNENMIEIASRRKLKNVNFMVGDILDLKFKSETFDIVFSERCLINIINWKSQCKALQNINKILRKKGHYIMLEAFDDGLNKLNQARKSLGLEKIPPAWHNYYFKKKRFEAYVKGKFSNWNSSARITYDNFLSSYYFGSRVLYPALIKEKASIAYNNKFVEYFSLIPSVGNYSQLQLCVLRKNE